MRLPHRIAVSVQSDGMKHRGAQGWIGVDREGEDGFVTVFGPFPGKSLLPVAQFTSSGQIYHSHEDCVQPLQLVEHYSFNAICSNFIRDRGRPPQSAFPTSDLGPGVFYGPQGASSNHSNA